MAKKKAEAKNTLLRWSEYIPASEVTDPLGLSLRGSTRIASLLLYCITSSTPRARYFSFIPWCIYNFQKQEKPERHAIELTEAVKLREKALTYGAVMHHDGQPCVGGSLVGSLAAKEWYPPKKNTVDLRKLPFAKNPALHAYLSSLINLGFFVEQELREESDEELSDENLAFENIELSEHGKELAEAYDSIVRRLGAVKAMSSRDRSCTVTMLKEFGKRGGLCELTDATAQDRPILTDIFFARKGLTEKSQFRRNRTLTLILELCRQLSRDNWKMNQYTFRSAVYYGQIFENGEEFNAVIPPSLVDIAFRWRMFYFHHYMSVALEGMFAWLVTRASENGLTGVTLNELAAELSSSLINQALHELDGSGQEKEQDLNSPFRCFEALGVSSPELTVAASRDIDRLITSRHSLAEEPLEQALLRIDDIQSSRVLAYSFLLFTLTLARFKQWEQTQYADWLRSNAAVRDPYLDLLPSTVMLNLSTRFENWWQEDWKELAKYILSRFVIQQHMSLAFEKTIHGDRCLLRVDGERIIAESPFNKIGFGNPRLGSAFQILTDLALWTTDQTDITRLTDDGLKLLGQEIDREMEQ